MTHPCPAYRTREKRTLVGGVLHVEVEVIWRCDRNAGEWSLCRACTAKAERNLGDIPALSKQLALTLSRQSVGGERVGGRSSEKPSAYHLGASEALSAMKGVLVGWVRDLMEGEPEQRWPADTHEGCALWLMARFGLLRVHPAAEEIARELAEVVERALVVIDREPLRLFAGFCGAEIEDVDDMEESA